MIRLATDRGCAEGRAIVNNPAVIRAPMFTAVTGNGVISVLLRCSDRGVRSIEIRLEDLPRTSPWR